jgi:DNA mismatch repair protein MutL
VTLLSEGTMRKQDILHRLLATLACHSSIRFNDQLSMAQMQKIVDDLFLCDQPYHCPHGRPTMMNVTLETLYKEFGR